MIIFSSYKRNNVLKTLKIQTKSNVNVLKGLIGVASAGSDCLVIAIADRNNTSLKVEHGLMKSRLTAVAGYIQDTFSQLNVPTL